MGAWNSVHYSEDNIRFKKAEEQNKMKDKTPCWKSLIEDLKKDGITIECFEKTITNEMIDKSSGYVVIDYDCLQKEYNLKDKRDIVWIKYSSNGKIGVVAVSNDINFNIPKDKNDYNKKKGSRWEYNTSGIIIHKLGLEWDTTKVTVFPIKEMPDGIKRHDVEKKIGECLLGKEIPILDYFSHQF